MAFLFKSKTGEKLKVESEFLKAKLEESEGERKALQQRLDAKESENRELLAQCAGTKARAEAVAAHRLQLISELDETKKLLEEARGNAVAPPRVSNHSGGGQPCRAGCIAPPSTATATAAAAAACRGLVVARRRRRPSDAAPTSGAVGFWGGGRCW